MIKRTLYFGNPARLSTRMDQMLIKRENEEDASVPIEDIGLVIFDNFQLSYTQALISKLLENNCAVLFCNDTHHPTGMLLNLDGHTLQSQKFKAQIEASLPLKKQLWQQTVQAKIENQAKMLRMQRKEAKYLDELAGKVKSNDADNCEALAASYYWKHVFPDFLQFTRHREGDPPNGLLNYGYSILRAVCARSLTASGLLPTLGIFHRNQYNAYCLADDIMEPYRPYVDRVVCDIVRDNGRLLEMRGDLKKILLGIPAMDVIIDGEKSPLMNAMQRTTASLARCFEGKQRRILYPQME